MEIYFKKRFWWEKLMNKSDALELARFIYSKIATKKTVQKVNDRFIWISFTENELNNL